MTTSRSEAKHGRIIGCVLMALLLVIFGWAPYGKSAAQGVEGAAQVPLAFSSGGTINFQGQLTTLAGAVLDGSYNLRFAIYDAPSGGSKRWPAGAYEEHAAVPVTGGLFSVQLGSIGGAIDASVFNGGGDRYLQVWVCTTAGAGCTTYDDMGRLPISSGAYAQTLALPAALESNAAATLLSVTNTGSGGALSGLAAAATGATSGVYGQSDSTSARAVYGHTPATSGNTYGVYGVAASTSGTGMLGVASATSGATYGVAGRSSSTGGYGVFGYATSASGVTFGVYGKTDSTDGRGVVGLAAATSGATRGVIGTANSPDGTGVLGLALASSGQTDGVRGESASPDGHGVYGYASSGSGVNFGVYGRAESNQGSGVYGYAPQTFGPARGVAGVADSPSGTGVYGEASALSGTTYGVYGRSNSPSGNGLFGYASALGGFTNGVQGRSVSPDGRGVYGMASATSGETYGVYGRSDSPDGRGVYGYAAALSGSAVGVYGLSSAANGYGVFGAANSAGNGPTYGVYGVSYNANGYGGKFDGYGADVVHVENLGTGRGIKVDTAGDTAIWAVTSSGLAGVDGRSALSTGRGVYGYATATTGANVGVYGRTASIGGRGVQGIAEATTGTNIGVYGETNSASGYAGYFADRVHVNGTLSKAAGSFKIDHPLDPANKYLQHSFVESPDMKNIYDGVVIVDDNGAATVTLPAWFEALNGGAVHRSDFRYQLTPLGAAMPNLHIAQEIQGNAFQIAGGKPGMKVSWQVTGIRHDPYAEQNRIVVETDKPAGERGTYLYPQGHDRPEQHGLDYERPEALPTAGGN